MKKLMLACLVGALVAGCFTASDKGVLSAPVRDVPVVVASGQTLEKAVLAAAARRRWTPSKTSETTYRLTISQRDNICTVDVVMAGNKSFSIVPVESNISQRKCEQWVNNLQREIVLKAQSPY